MIPNKDIPKRVHRNSKSQAINRNRIDEVDYFKAIFISFMILFHLPIINLFYPYLHDVIYSFHMPGFLLISGYFANTDKSISSFAISIGKLFIPYLIIVTTHTCLNYALSGVIPMQQAISEINLSVFLNRIFLHPANPYWYINTLIICLMIEYLIVKFVKLKGLNAYIALGISLYAITYVSGMEWHNAMCFLVGHILKGNTRHFLSIFQPSLFASIPLIIMFSIPDNLHVGSLSSLTITYLVICFLQKIYKYIPLKGKCALHYIGRNTLLIVLFSPFFTAISKVLIPAFSFDTTGFCYAIVAIIFTILGCLLCGMICDLTHLSKYIFLTSKIIK